MRDFYKHPFFFYVAVPAFLILWPVSAWLIQSPAANKALANAKYQYVHAQDVIDEIIALDPDRLQLIDPKNASAQFDYAIAVQKVASMHRIPPASYKLASGMLIKTGGQKSQSARVSLKNVNITQVADFISTIQFHWPDIQCNTLKITRRKDSSDSWDADFDFKYFF